MLQEGDLAPEFELRDDSGDIVALGALLQEGQLVLFFYPADFSPICTLEAGGFRDCHGDLAEIGIRVFGISPQTAASHQRFRRLHHLPFPLLEDRDKKVARSFGVLGPFGFGVRRATFLIDRDRRILRRVVADLSVSSHLALVRELVVENRSDEGRSEVNPGQENRNPVEG